MDLQQFFKENKEVGLGFSGGVDSSYLLYAGMKYGAKIKAYYVKTAFQPEFEFEDAKKMAEKLGADLTVINFDILGNEAVRSNPADRCYFCKSEIFGAVRQRAIEDGVKLLIDGTNASDDEGDRPGIRALKELKVLSPLRLCGLTKPEIRKLSKEAGLFTWDKPAYACLATRIPTGTGITHELLQKVEGAENEIAKLGIKDFRVRVFNGSARLQVTENDMEKVYENRRVIVEKLKKYFGTVLVDLESR